MDASNEPKISIIVPVYNAEPYLRKCLDSIAAQTHKNLEVILVDDGSPDNCPAICDEYAANDPRFKTIHKQNGGPGSAYNAGLDAATGEWIGFVDNDDWVEPDMFEYLLAGAQRHGAKMAACGYYRTDGQREKACAFERECVLPGKQAARATLEGSLQLIVFPWQKIYACELWDGIRFTEAPYAPPDVAPGLAVPLRAESVVCLPGVKYHWRRRRGSYSNNRSLRSVIVFYRLWEELCSGPLAQEPELCRALTSEQIQAAWQVWGAYYTAPLDERKAVMPQLREISASCRPYIGQAAQDHEHIGLAGRIGCRLVAWPTWWSFALSHVLWKLYLWKNTTRL